MYIRSFICRFTLSYYKLRIIKMYTLTYLLICTIAASNIERIEQTQAITFFKQFRNNLISFVTNMLLRLSFR